MSGRAVSHGMAGRWAERARRARWIAGCAWGQAGDWDRHASEGSGVTTTGGRGARRSTPAAGAPAFGRPLYRCPANGRAENRLRQDWFGPRGQLLKSGATPRSRIAQGRHQAADGAQGLAFARPESIAVGIPAWSLRGVLWPACSTCVCCTARSRSTSSPSRIERAIAEEVAGLHVHIEGVALRLGDGGQLEFELKNVRVTDAGGVPLASLPPRSVSLSRKALLSGRIAPESVDLIAPRLSLFYSEDGTLSLKFAPPAETHRKRAGAIAGAARHGAARRRRAAGNRRRRRVARPHRPRQGAVRDLRARTAARARQRLPARDRTQGPPPSSSTTAAARASGACPSSTSISTTGAAAARLPAAPRSTRCRARGPSTSAPTSTRTAKTLQLAVSVQGLVPRGLARTLPQLAGLESLDVPVWGDARLDLSSTGEILSGTIGIDAAPGQVLLPWLAATPLTYRRRSSLAVLQPRRAPFRGRALGARLG